VADDVLEAWNEYYDCTSTQMRFPPDSPPFPLSYEFSCREQVHSCLATGLDWSCGEIVDCITESSDIALWGGECPYNGSFDAYCKWSELLECMDGSLPSTYDDSCLWFEDPGCFVQVATWRCVDELSLCTSGTSSCGTVLSAMEQCGQQDRQCQLSSMVSGTAAAQAQLSQIIGCVISECGLEYDEECWSQSLQAACLEVYEACVEDGLD